MSNAPLLTPEIREFLRQFVRSIWGLEVLLLLYANPEKQWRRAEISREIRGSMSVVDDALSVFIKASLVSESDSGLVRYQPADQQLADLVMRLAEVNAAYPFAVMKEIIWAPNDKLRTFVDAFRLKKD